MISSLGFIPNSSEIKELNAFVPDEQVKERLSYLQIPILDPPSDEGGEEEPPIKATDSILFCTPNTEEISNLAFYAYDDQEIFFHHDLFVFSTIIDSAYLGNNLVALATFEPDIFVYDFLTRLPVLPQKLLCGHEGAVTGLKNKENRVFSCSDDKTIIEWDLSRMCPKNRVCHDVSIDRFDFHGNDMVFGCKTYLNINDENIPLNFQMEQLRMQGNYVYVSDSEGNMAVYDARRVGSTTRTVLSKKIHDQAVVDFCIVDDWIATTSLDSYIRLWDLGLDLKNELEQSSAVYALGYNNYLGEKEIFAGNEENFVFPIKLECSN